MRPPPPTVAGVTTLTPLPQDQPLRKGLNKVYVRFGPLRGPIAEAVSKSNRVWDLFVVPSFNKQMAAKGQKTELLRGNWVNLKTLESRNSPAPGFEYRPRKGYDPKTRALYVWLAVR